MTHAPTHVYTGPTNRYGLERGTPGWKSGTRAGGAYFVRATDGKRFIVGLCQLSTSPRVRVTRAEFVAQLERDQSRRRAWWHRLARWILRRP